jgi:hypothetical protein
MSGFISSLTLLVVFAVASAQPAIAQTDSANSKASSNKKPFAKVKIEGFDGSQEAPERWFLCVRNPRRRTQDAAHELLRGRPPARARAL